jgi:hypothetical protein
MCDKFLNAGVPIEKVYISPFHATAGLGAYRKNNISRKLYLRMILLAEQELNLNLVNLI